jgi:multiple sugar transport system permease protein
MSHGNHVRGRFLAALRYLAILILLALFLLPIYAMLTMSLKLPDEVISLPPNPFHNLSLANYRTVLFGAKLEGAELVSGGNIQFARALTNSIIISVSATALALIFGVPAAYALARYRFRGKRDLAIFFLSTRFAPPMAVLIPYFILFSKLHLLDTHLALIIMYTTINLSLVVWMMMGFIRELPPELEEAGQVDGCTRVGALVRITLPLVMPGLVATTVFAVMTSWNEFLFAVMLTSVTARTAPVAALGYIRYMFVAWGPLTAAGTLIALPMLVFVLIFQQRLVRGLTLGALHG